MGISWTTVSISISALWQVASSLWLEMNSGRGVITTEIGKHCTSEVLQGAGCPKFQSTALPLPEGGLFPEGAEPSTPAPLCVKREKKMNLFLRAAVGILRISQAGRGGGNDGSSAN